ncbi:MAG: GtrA family protein [Blastocatellia bacterium]|nr:GtrA family protein [Blastocatellia bacterium]
MEQEERSRLKQLTTHWVKFNIVGLLGIGIQLAALQTLLLSGLGYLTATGLAVEAAILHNFFLHQRWTWKDRPRKDVRDSLQRLIRFNSTTGLISIFGNLLLMNVLVGWLHLNALVANLSAIVACSFFNFLVTDIFVFRKQSSKLVV